MNTFKFGTTLKYVLEFFIASALFILLIKGSFLLLNLASTIFNLLGGALLLTTSVSYVYYVIGFIKRINNHINDKL
jgi:hypothetical protein